MSNAPERPQGQREPYATPREDAALPVPNTGNSPHISAKGADPADSSDTATAANAAKRRTILRVVGGTVVLTVVMSVALEYAGWQIAFRTMPEPHTPISILPFLRGVRDTILGAVGIGAAGVVGTLLLPSTRRHAWRRVPTAFAVGAGAFIAFLSFVTFGFFG